MANINQHQVRQVTVFQGVAEIARAEGVHKSYISKILHGAVAGPLPPRPPGPARSARPPRPPCSRP